MINYWGAVQYKALVGSVAYGLATENSDLDYRGFYAPNTKDFLGIHNVPEQLTRTDKSHPEDVFDEVYWELGKYFKLLIANNPNVLESLWSEVYETNPQSVYIVESLRENRSLFLSQNVIKTYGGYSTQQWHKGLNLISRGEKTEKQGWKFLSHYFRLLISGTYALLNGENILVDVYAYRELLTRIKQGYFSITSLEEIRKDHELRFNNAKKITSLPEKPNYEKINELLIEYRMNLMDYTYD